MKKIYIMMAACAILGGCGNGPRHEHAHEHEHEHEHTEAHTHEHENEHSHEHEREESHERGHEAKGHSDEIIVTPHQRELLGIRVDTVKAGEFNEVIKASGQVISSNGDETTIVARSAGIVGLGGVAEGSAVAKGGKIATISTKGIGGGDQLAKAKAAYEAAKNEFERDKELIQDNIVSKSHFDQSKLAYETAKAEYEALASGNEANGEIVVSSPIGGFVKSLAVRQGDYVETGQPIATVSQNRRLRLKADVSERYYGKISQIRDANFMTSYGEKAYSLKELGGRLLSYGRSSGDGYYIPVIFEFDNKGDIVPGSFVDIFLKTNASSKAITVPVEAVVEEQGVKYVFIQIDEEGFMKREVRLGQSDGKRFLVESGLGEGEVVVVSGAMKVKLASVTAAPAGHNHNH